MQAVSLGGLLVDDVLQFRQVAGAGADKFFFQDDLQHNIVVIIAGCLRDGRLLLKRVKNAHDKYLLFFTAEADFTN